MGLLDDAIREHLDLKRRRGGDPAEIERAEREALGPVRRNREPDDSAEFADEAPAAAGGFAYDQDDDEWASEAPGDMIGAGDPDEVGDELYADRYADPSAGTEEAAPAAPPPVDRGRRSAAPGPPEAADEAAEDWSPVDEGDADWSAADEGELPADAFPTAGPTSRGAPELSDETAAYDVEDALSADPGAPESGSAPEGPYAPESPRAPEGPHAHEEDDPDEDMLEETPDFLQDTPDHDRLWFEQRPPRDFDFDG